MSVVKEVENEATATLLDLKTQRNNLIHAITREHRRLTTRRLLVRDRNSRCDIFTMEKVIMYKRKAKKAALDIKDVKKSFKKFDTLADHSGHLFAHENSPMNKANNMFVRFYESRMHLLRVAIIGAKGTPYHDGLFFFDVYHSGGLEINPNLYKNGRVRLSLPKQTSMTREVEVDMWVPGTSKEDEGITSTMEFRKDVASCMKLLVTAFKWIGAEELPPI
ncbi:ubiquitin-conjugating enzyme family protein [Tanacetum coccineum]